MTLIPILILAAGLNGAVSNALPASPVQHAVGRMVAAAAPAIHRRAVSHAMAAGTRRHGTDIARESAFTPVKAANSPAPQPQSRSNRFTEESEPGLETYHFPPLPKLNPASAVIEFGSTGSSAQAVPPAPQSGLPASLVGGLLMGFLALAGLAATAFTRWTR